MRWRPSHLSGDLPIGIVHLGLGAFHRAHQAAFTEDAVTAKGGDWGISAVSMRSPAQAELMRRAGLRYTLVEQHPDGPQGQQISAIREALALPEGVAPVIDRLAAPSTLVVTITVTEKGYGVRAGSRPLDESHPAIHHDLANPAAPSGLIGLLVAGLRQRRTAGLGGLTLMSCDNLPSNGRLLSDLVCSFAERLDPTLSRWITETCACPDSMVDRITPAPTQETRALAAQMSRREEPAAVETEPFRQWVIENRFAGPRPAWEAAGALIVDDVAPFEEMKLRMLNGAHSMIAYMGTVAGFPSVRDVMREPAFSGLVRRHMDAAAATLSPVPGLAFDDYREALIARFSNPAIDHRCLQIAMDGSQKMPQRIFLGARAALERGQSFETFAFATAVWIRHLCGRTEDGTALPIDDPMSDALNKAALTMGPAENAVRVFGSLPGLDTSGLFDRPEWVDEVARHLETIRERGVLNTARLVGS